MSGTVKDFVWPKDRDGKVEIEWNMIGKVFVGGRVHEYVRISKLGDHFTASLWSEGSEVSAHGWMKDVERRRFKTLAEAMRYVDPNLESDK